MGGKLLHLHNQSPFSASHNLGKGWELVSGSLDNAITRYKEAKDSGTPA